ncbi:MAG: M23 family metallopeptidase [Elusimicrobia bacterium]|nr:M23 family metallopeptidase [Elusimicrobiota bacterium]
MRNKYYIISAVAVLASFFSLGAIAQMGRPSLNYAGYSVIYRPYFKEPPAEAFRKIPRFLYGNHKLKKGETVSSLASAYSTDIKSIQSANRNEFILMPYGASVKIHNGRGLLYETYKEGESFNSLISRFCPKGEKPEIFAEKTAKANGFPASYIIENKKFPKGQKIILPGVYVNLDTYRIPVNGFVRISSGYGNRFHPILKRRIFHKGCDIPMPLGSSVYPARSGTVIFSGYKSGYGYTVEVKHKDGYVTRYGHLKECLVNEGQIAQKGKTLLGKVGSSGLSTGPHLHFEILTPSGKSVNPISKIGKN